MKACVVLISSITSSSEQEHNTRALNALLDAKKIDRKYVDGAVEENWPLRNELFELSGVRGKYPQVFLQADGQYEFLGMYPKLHELNEMSDIPVHLRERNNIQTLDSILQDVKKQ